MGVVVVVVSPKGVSSCYISDLAPAVFDGEEEGVGDEERERKVRFMECSQKKKKGQLILLSWTEGEGGSICRW